MKVDSFSLNPKQNSKLLFWVLAFIFLSATVFRLRYIKAPGISIDREYTSAIIARSFYYKHLETLEPWQRDIAEITKQNQPILEPPITEYLVSLIYRVFGTETIWISHLITTAFWLLGGLYLFKVGNLIFSPGESVFALIYYLFAPLGLHLSRSFQPEPLMMLLFLFGLYRILFYFKEQSSNNLIFAGVLSGFTVLYRPMVIFTLFCVFAALEIYKRDSWKSLFSRRNAYFILLLVAPSFLYYGYGLFIAGYLRWWVGFGFLPHLYLHLDYWKGWLNLAVLAVGYLGLIGALFGITKLRNGVPMVTIGGLWIGYIIFGLVFSVHIHTHLYYHAQLIPIVALSLSPLFKNLLSSFERIQKNWFLGIPLTTAIILIAYINFQNFRNTLHYDVYNIQQKAQEIGQIIDHSEKTIFVARYYGLPLQYFGKLTGAYWPRKINYWLYQKPGDRELSVEERLDSLGFLPEYFVITNFSEYQEHHLDLRDFLQDNCQMVSKANDNFLIYEDCKY